MIQDESRDEFADEITEPPAEIGVMDFAADDGFGIGSGAGSGRRIDRNAVVLGVIVISAAIGLWSMRTLSPSMAADESAGTLPRQIALQPIEEGVMRRLTTRSLVDHDLTTDRDPFALWGPAFVNDHASMVEELIDDGLLDRATMCADWQDRVDEIAFMLTLKSVLGGGTPRALVNIEGVLLALGETFDITDTDIVFRVEGTGRRSVRLEAHNAELDCWHAVEVSMDRD